MLKNVTFLLLFILAVSGSLPGMEVSDSTIFPNKILIGIHFGLYISNLHAPRIGPSGPPFGTTYLQVKDNGSAGFSTGIFRDSKKERKYSIQPEINFMWFSHKINMEVIRSSPSYISNDEYNVSYFNMQFCLLPKLTFGKKSGGKIMAGPYVRIPLTIYSNGEKVQKSEETLQNCAGIIARLRFDTTWKSVPLGFEICGGSDLIFSSKAYRETSITLGLLFVFRI